MAPTKRARPSFSPPRPGKSRPALSSKDKGATTTKRKSTLSSHEASKKKDKSKYVGRKGTRQAILDEAEEDDEESEEEVDVRSASKRRKEKARSALDLVDMEASEEESEESDGHHDDENDDDEGDEDNDDSTVNREPTHLDMSSPEPDMILAEVTVAPEEASDARIPPQLVHKIIQHHFERGEVTKMGRDARDLVTEYIELFVREAVLRSNNERMVREGTDEGSGVLEVEDLERSAVQLALDF